MILPGARMMRLQRLEWVYVMTGVSENSDVVLLVSWRNERDVLHQALNSYMIIQSSLIVFSTYPLITH